MSDTNTNAWLLFGIEVKESYFSIYFDRSKLKTYYSNQGDEMSLLVSYSLRWY